MGNTIPNLEGIDPDVWTKKSNGNGHALEEMRERSTAVVSIIIPAFNEENQVAAEVERVRAVMQEHGLTHEIIVVDDGSADATAERALAAGARVVRHSENRGYGASLKTGIVAAQYNTIAIIDADGTYPADQLPVMLEKLEMADMVVGARTGKVVKIPLVRKPAKWFVRQLAVQIAGRPIPDLNSGLRVFRRDTLKQYFPILSNRFSFTTTSTLALISDEYRVVYHPINYFERVGKSKIRPRHALDFTMLVLRMAMLFNPMRVFVPLALTLMGLGIVKVLYDVLSFYPRTGVFDWRLVFSPVLSTSAVLLLLVGLQLLLIGMVADGALKRMGQSNGPLLPSRGTYVLDSHSAASLAALEGARTEEKAGQAAA